MPPAPPLSYMIAGQPHRPDRRICIACRIDEPEPAVHRALAAVKAKLAARKCTCRAPVCECAHSRYLANRMRELAALAERRMDEPYLCKDCGRAWDAWVERTAGRRRRSLAFVDTRGGAGFRHAARCARSGIWPKSFIRMVYGPDGAGLPPPSSRRRRRRRRRPAGA